MAIHDRSNHGLARKATPQPAPVAAGDRLLRSSRSPDKPGVSSTIATRLFSVHRGEFDFRATVRRDGAVRLVHWTPSLAAGGPLHTLLDARGRAGVGIADLIVLRDDNLVAAEVIVEFRCGGAPAHHQALHEWAARVGYHRVWADDQIIDVDPSPGGAAQTRCSGCRVRLVDDGPSFWDFVRRHGAFPTACVLCGSDLPQWTPVRQTRSPSRDPDATETSRRPACR